jgi:thymidylate synthase
MVVFIESDSIAGAYEELVSRIMSDGCLVVDERGDTVRELLNVVVRVSKPLCDNFFGIDDSILSIRVPDGCFWRGDKLKTYCTQFFNKCKGGFKYTYGNRLRNHFDGVDQICNAINRLNECKESRRAVSVTWDQVLDSESSEVPCMILVDFKIRDGKLNTTAVWRSHDAFGAYFPNLVGLSYLAQYVAKETDSVVGNVVVQSISAHINEYDFCAADKLLTDKEKSV